MKLSKHVLYSAGAFVAIAAVASITSPKLTAAVKAAYVEMVLPSQPFHQGLGVSDAQGEIGFGPDTGKLGVTNITVTNFDTSPNVVVIQKPGSPGAGCQVSPGDVASGAVVAYWYVQGKSTLSATYPAPLVVDSVNGHTCLKVSTFAKTVFVDVSGFIN